MLPLVVSGLIVLARTGIEVYQRYANTPLGHAAKGAVMIAGSKSLNPSMQHHAQSEAGKEFGTGLNQLLHPNQQHRPPQT